MPIYTVDEKLPNAKSEPVPGEREVLRRVIRQRGLGGLANDTKWNELIEAMRVRPNWAPSYRYKCVDGPPSKWEVGWFYHLPFPMLSVEWLDIAFIQEVRLVLGRLEHIDHSPWIEKVLKGIGMDYCKGSTMFRVFGYSPRDMELFDD